MKAIILILLLTVLLGSSNAQNLQHITKSTDWTRPLRSNKNINPNLSVADYILEENDLLKSENKINFYPLDKNNHFDWTTKKLKDLKLRSKSYIDIRKFNSYSTNRAN